jgi:hypothetical protein
MLNSRWYVYADGYQIDGPFVFKFIADAHATSHRAHAAQLARYEGIPMPDIDVAQVVTGQHPTEL